jgi:hypothetical protein
MLTSGTSGESTMAIANGTSTTGIMTGTNTMAVMDIIIKAGFLDVE